MHKALSFDNQNATYYMLRGRVQLARREYSSAIGDNQVAILLNPSFAAAHCGLGDSWLMRAVMQRPFSALKRL